MQSTYDEVFFQINEAHAPAFLDLVFELGLEAIEEKDNGFYVRSDEDLQTLVEALELFKTKLEQELGQDIQFTSSLSKKANQDWIELYKKGIKPLELGKFYIHTSWQKAHDTLINIKIDPALAFGSGHHESTHSCIELLQKYAKKGQKALDIGCGSGILSIVLAKLACKVSACDTDELAVQSTLSNAKLNGIILDELWQGSLDKSSKTYDILVANLVCDIILMLEKDLKKTVSKGGFLILSGILNRYEERIKESFCDLKLLEMKQANEWLSFVYKKEEQ